ncbi:MAG: polyphenol oxidase family protein [Myxococcota bacterium]|nr:polyphenol oxidase family protein [Myxococcota bacterium]
MTPLFIQAPELSGIKGLLHGFSRRSLSDGHVLDLGRDASPALWAKVAAELGSPGAGIAMVSQVHGSSVIVAEGAGILGEADALITRQRGLLLAIRTADCVPVLVVGHDGEIAAIHAGWRGIAAGVIPAALSAMAAPKHAVVGPCISAAAYQVGEEVIDGIVAAGVPASVVADRSYGARPHADLKAAARWQLAQSGVSVEVLPHCTFRDGDLHSYRRDGVRSGRLAAVIGWCP